MHQSSRNHDLNRKTFIGGSDARVIMGTDEDKLLRLPHRMGAALTYARRYALFAIVGLRAKMIWMHPMRHLRRSLLSGQPQDRTRNATKPSCIAQLCSTAQIPPHSGMIMTKKTACRRKPLPTASRRSCRQGPSAASSSAGCAASRTGHIHRATLTMFAGVPTTICPAPNHAVHLDLAELREPSFKVEPPAFHLHT
jgi:hypothetical protein